MPSTGPGAISEALFGKTKQGVIGLLFSHPDESFYLRQIARSTGASAGTVQRELRQLSHAGLILREPSGHQVYFRANPASPIFAELKGLAIKTAGLGDVLRAALAPLADRIRVAFIFGSFARGTAVAASDVDLMVVGDVEFGEVVDIIGPPENQLNREVNPVVYPVAEFQRKVAGDHPFVSEVVREPKIFLIGDQRELEGLAR